MLLARDPIVHAPYVTPDHFGIRIIALLACLAGSSVIVSALMFSVPGSCVKQE
jgi:hypothetical protein